jgi:hypothetical protein
MSSKLDKNRIFSGMATEHTLKEVVTAVKAINLNVGDIILGDISVQSNDTTTHAKLDVTNSTIGTSNNKLDTINTTITNKHLNKTLDSVDISGQRVDISGQRVDISGQTLNVSGSVSINNNSLVVDPINNSINEAQYDLIINGATLWADSLPAGNPFYADPNGREGWYYDNLSNESNRSNIYWYGNPTTGNLQENDMTFSQLSDMYCIVTNDYVENGELTIPIMLIYSQPTGSNDIIPGFSHSSWAYSLTNTNVTKLRKGECVMLYTGATRPNVHINLPSYPLELAATNGDALSSEIIAYMSVNTQGTTSKIGYLLQYVGYLNSAIGFNREYSFKNSKERLGEDNLSKLKFTGDNLNVNIASGSLTVDISGQTVVTDISGQRVDIGGQTINVNTISNYALEANGNLEEIRNKTDNLNFNDNSGVLELNVFDIQNYTKLDSIETYTSKLNDLTYDASSNLNVNIASGSLTVDISGQRVVTDISGQTVVTDISGQRVVTDISGQRVDISGQRVVTDISGQRVVTDISGQRVVSDISGQRVDISGQRVLVDISGQRVVTDISGQTVVTDISGQRVVTDISGQRVLVDISGQRVVSDISGQRVDISGQTIDVHNKVYHSGNWVNLVGASNGHLLVNSSTQDGNGVDITSSTVNSKNGLDVNVINNTVKVDISGVNTSNNRLQTNSIIQSLTGDSITSSAFGSGGGAKTFLDTGAVLRVNAGSGTLEYLTATGTSLNTNITNSSLPCNVSNTVNTNANITNSTIKVTQTANTSYVTMNAYNQATAMANPVTQQTNTGNTIYSMDTTLNAFDTNNFETVKLTASTPTLGFTPGFSSNPKCLDVRGFNKAYNPLLNTWNDNTTTETTLGRNSLDVNLEGIGRTSGSLNTNITNGSTTNLDGISGINLYQIRPKIKMYSLRGRSTNNVNNAMMGSAGSTFTIFDISNFGGWAAAKTFYGRLTGIGQTTTTITYDYVRKSDFALVEGATINLNTSAYSVLANDIISINRSYASSRYQSVNDEYHLAYSQSKTVATNGYVVIDNVIQDDSSFVTIPAGYIGWISQLTAYSSASTQFGVIKWSGTVQSRETVYSIYVASNFSTITGNTGSLGGIFYPGDTIGILRTVASAQSYISCNIVIQSIL